jgi:hypothetical protein
MEQQCFDCYKKIVEWLSNSKGKEVRYFKGTGSTCITIFQISNITIAFDIKRQYVIHMVSFTGRITLSLWFLNPHNILKNLQDSLVSKISLRIKNSIRLIN